MPRTYASRTMLTALPAQPSSRIRPALILAGRGMQAFLISVMGSVARMRSEAALMIPAERFVAKRLSASPQHLFCKALMRNFVGTPHENRMAKK